MERLIAFTGRWRRHLIAVWVAAILLSLPLMLKQSSHLTAGGYEVAGSASHGVQQLIASDYPSLSQEQLILVISCDERAVPDVVEQQLGAAVETTESLAGRSVTVSPPALDAANSAAADGAREVVLPLQVGAGWSGAIDIARDLDEEFADVGDEVGCRTLVAGRGAQAAALNNVSEQGLRQAELLGLPILLVLLLMIFGSLTAALMPLALAGASLVITGAAIYLVSMNTMMSVFSLNMASMIGLGVAIDYALFVVTRFREELGGGASVEEARATSLRTSGVAVIASGATVVAALSSVFIVDNAALRSMALGAVIVVCVAVLATVTLLPSLLVLCAGRIGRVTPRRDGITENGFWFRWTARILDRPLMTTGAALAVLVIMALPVLSIQVGDDTIRQLPADDPARQAAEIVRELQGAGADAPVIVTVTPHDGASVDTDVEAFLADARTHSVVRDAAIVGVHGNDRVIALTLDTDYESDEARAFVRELRGEIIPASDLADRSEVMVGGAGASGVDLVDLIRDRLPVVVGLVLLLAYLLLAFLLRSIILPVKAVITNLMSVAAGFGAIVVLFQWGWFSSITGIEPTGHVQALALPLILAVVFGLSMDYEVFLLARIRERWEMTGDDRRAVAEGLGSTARVITSAAVIMVAVFASFAVTGIPVVQQLGVGCAVAVAIDATLTRLVLVPATMSLLGRWNWYYPEILTRRRQPTEVNA